MPLDDQIPPILINIRFFPQFPEPKPPSFMPTSETSPRQDLRVWTTKALESGGDRAPLHQNPFTTYFMLPFSLLISRFLQFILKMTKYTSLNSHKSGGHFFYFRVYVVNSSCTQGHYQSQWLSWRTALILRCFFLFILTLCLFLLHILETPRSMFLKHGFLAGRYLLNLDFITLVIPIYGCLFLRSFFFFDAP